MPHPTCPRQFCDPPLPDEGSVLHHRDPSGGMTETRLMFVPDDGAVWLCILQRGLGLFGGSRYEGSFCFDNEFYLARSFSRLSDRLANEKRGRGFARVPWPHRFNRSHCTGRFIGSLRGLVGGTRRRELSFAVVSSTGHELLEVSDAVDGESSFRVPLTFFDACLQALTAN